MSLILDSFWRAVAYCLHPRVIALSMLPLALMIAAAFGLGYFFWDAALDAVRLLERAEYLVVATDSRVVLETVRRTLGLLRRVRAPILGIVENMRRDEGGAVRELAREYALDYLGALPWDAAIEPATGDPQRLARTDFATELGRLVDRLV